MNRIVLLTIMSISCLFQLVVGIWIIIDIKSAGDVLLGNIENYDLLYKKEFFIISQIAAKAFLMLSVYSLLTIYFIIKKHIAGYLLALVTGLMISIIAITTYIETQSYMVWITDFSRGSIITLTSSIILMRETRKKRIGKETI